MDNTQEPHLIQRSPEWLKWRRGKLTATDACVLMNGVHFGKTVLDLYNEKTSDQALLDNSNFAMRRGVELEPLALAKFEAETGYLMTPRVLTHWNGVYPFLSASLDGYEIEGKCAVEVKCPGKEDHALALKGIVPEKYVPQLHHIMIVTGLTWIYYMSYVSDEDFTIFKVQKDNDYAAKLIQAELEFWQRVQDRNPPQPTDRDTSEIKDPNWIHTCDKYRAINSEKKDVLAQLARIEAAEDEIKNELISLSNNKSVFGAGLRLTKSVRRGHIDYARVVELLEVSNEVLESYRKPFTEYWRVSFKEEEEE